MTEPAVAVRNVTRTFSGKFAALGQIDLSTAAGEFVAILGPSGCGKSTLLRLVAGLDQPTTGTVAADRDRAAYVFQDAHLLPWRTVLRNVALPLELAGVGRRDRAARAKAALDRVGLADAADRYPAQLSGGMRMRASLARAVVTGPSLLLLDEPFAALDEITRQRLDDQLRGLWRAGGLTVLFVTHSTAEAVYLADRVVVLSPRPGRVVLDRPVELPADRDAVIRGSAEFARETRAVYEALERG